MSLQGSEAWRLDRAGHVTASRITDVMAKDTTAARRNYKAEIVAEILSGSPIEAGYVSADMKRGTEQEPFARVAYEIRTGAIVNQCGFVKHPTIERAGCSPDGLIGEDGLIEIKVPKLATHIEYLLAGKVPAEYIPQMCWQLACTGRQWNDFVSYSPELPEHLSLFVARIECDLDVIRMMESKVRQFLAECDQLLAQLETRVGA
jgi:predicted phage-related endonuclease